MNHSQKSLVFGILFGVLLSSSLFGGSIFLWIQANSADLRVSVNRQASISIGGLDFKFSYSPNSNKIFVANGLDQNSSIPSNVGFVYSWSWGVFIVTKVNPDYVLLHFRPLKFSSIQDVATQSLPNGASKIGGLPSIVFGGSHF